MSPEERAETAVSTMQGTRDLKERVAAAIREAVAEAAPRWTPCAEGLPAEGVEVLVWLGEDTFILGYLHRLRGAAFWLAGDVELSLEEVRAWQPLPPGPNEDDPPPPPVP